MARPLLVPKKRPGKQYETAILPDVYVELLEYFRVLDATYTMCIRCRLDPTVHTLGKLVPHGAFSLPLAQVLCGATQGNGRKFFLSLEHVPRADGSSNLELVYSMLRGSSVSQVAQRTKMVRIALVDFIRTAHEEWWVRDGEGIAAGQADSAWSPDTHSWHPHFDLQGLPLPPPLALSPGPLQMMIPHTGEDAAAAAGTAGAAEGTAQDPAHDYHHQQQQQQLRTAPNAMLNYHQPSMDTGTCSPLRPLGTVRAKRARPQADDGDGEDEGEAAPAARGELALDGACVDVNSPAAAPAPPAAAAATSSTAERFLEHLRSLPFYSDQLVATVTLPGRAAVFVQGCPVALHPHVWRCITVNLGYSQLYRHQHRAIDSIMAEQHVVVSTSTASGKSLIYNAAVLSTFCSARDAAAQGMGGHTSPTALYMFPTKALAQDQLRALRVLMGVGTGVGAGVGAGLGAGTEYSADRAKPVIGARVFVVDGDTGPSARQEVAPCCCTALLPTRQPLPRPVLCSHSILTPVPKCTVPPQSSPYARPHGDQT